MLYNRYKCYITVICPSLDVDNEAWKFGLATVGGIQALAG